MTEDVFQQSEKKGLGQSKFTHALQTWNSYIQQLKAYIIQWNPQVCTKFTLQFLFYINIKQYISVFLFILYYNISILFFI